MTAIKCCKGCVAQKRHTACWSHCPEYLKEKAEYEQRKAIEDKKKRTEQDIYLQRSDAVTKAMKGRRIGAKNYLRGKMNNG